MGQSRIAARLARTDSSVTTCSAWQEGKNWHIAGAQAFLILNQKLFGIAPMYTIVWCLTFTLHHLRNLWSTGKACTRTSYLHSKELRWVGMRAIYLGLIPPEDFWILYTVLAGWFEPITATSVVKKKKCGGKEPVSVFHWFIRNNSNEKMICNIARRNRVINIREPTIHTQQK